MNNQVTTKSMSALDVAAIARELGPRMADLTSFMKDLRARQNALALFVTTKKAAITALELTEGEQRAAGVWKGMTQEEQSQYLLDIGTPKEAIDQMRQILASGPHRMFVVRAMEIVDDVENCQTFVDFVKFATKAEMAHRIVRNYQGEDAVTVYDTAAREEVHYGPENTPVLEAAWPYVVSAWRILREKRDLYRAEREERLEQVRIERKERATKLAPQATPGLTLLDVVNGKEGTIMVELDESRVALVTFSEICVGYATVEIPETNYSSLRWRPILVDIPSFEPKRGYWPDDSFGFRRALQVQLQRERVNQELQEHLAVLRTPDLLPVELGQQSMTQVLLGKKEGSALAYHKQFMDGDTSGFLGVIVSHKEGKFTLVAVNSDLPFPQDLVGKELPIQVQNRGAGDAPIVTMDLTDTPEQHARALGMVRRLLVIRTRLENPRR